jgi:hypothetical protein
MEWVAMPFGPYNPLVTIKRMMNDIMRDILHKFVKFCVDDICVYSRTLKEHLEHQRLVLQRLNEKGMRLHLKKCIFMQILTLEMNFL